MLVFHFVPLCYGIENIQKRRLKIAEIDNLNDPFDLLSPYCADAEFRSILRTNIALAKERVGLLCFSRDWHNPVQWTHYAEQHRGVCLVFEVAPNAVRQVRYVKGRQVIDWRSWDYGDELTKRIVDLSFRKFDHWKYEDEVRSVVNLREGMIIRDNGYFFMPFNEEISLRRVILGSRCSLGKSGFVGLVGEDALNNVEIWKARMAFRTFRIVRQLDASLWR